MCGSSWGPSATRPGGMSTERPADRSTVSCKRIRETFGPASRGPGSITSSGRKSRGVSAGSLGVVIRSADWLLFARWSKRAAATSSCRPKPCSRSGTCRCVNGRFPEPLPPRGCSRATSRRTANCAGSSRFTLRRNDQRRRQRAVVACTSGPAWSRASTCDNSTDS